MSYPLYGNVIIDSSNGTALGGTLTISNSCNTSVLNNRASIAFAVADISYGTLNRGLFSGGVDFADARITAIVDTVSPTVGTGLSISVSPNHANPPVEALRVQSNGNVGIGTQTPQFSLDVNGNARIGTTSTNTFTLFNNRFYYVDWTAILDRSGEWDTDNPATANPFIDVIDASGVTGAFIPRPASIALSGTTTREGSITKYYYSVMGKILYLNWYHFQSTNTGAANGTGTYLYRIPTGFPLATWLLQTTNPPNSNNAYTGTRIGSGIFYVAGAARESVSAYYVNITGARGGGGIARDYICIFREPVTASFQSSTSFGYNNAGSTQYTFQAEIPLA
jgi:hypothetical protein